jgi:hypothetical protein
MQSNNWEFSSQLGFSVIAHCRRISLLAIILYESYPATRIVLTFDSAGRLHYFHAEWPKMQAQEKP